MEEALDRLVSELAAHSGPLSPEGLERAQRRHPRPEGGFYSKRDILRHFRARHPQQGGAAADFAERLRTCPTRSLAGVLPVAVLTAPFPCPGRCVFCPNDVRQPKSYLSNEPGCQRATANRFDPYLQAWNRLAAYRHMGHPTGKVELIVLGGTWSFHPVAYQRWFVKRLFDALSDFGDGIDGRADAERTAREAPDPRPDALDPPRVAGRYNDAVGRMLRDQLGDLTAVDEAAEAAELAAAQRRNESAGARCVGLVIETRPDAIDAAEVLRLRELGVTKVQLGIQHLDERVLAANQRGHGAEESRRAVTRLRAAGFKIHAHWMPNLLGATPEIDRRDFARLFDDPALRPDELKVYPCSLVETAELAAFHQRGEWAPYARDALVALLADCLERVPGWCRVTRVIRDIPSTDIVIGNKTTNLREVVEAFLEREGRRLGDIRSREVRGRSVDVRAVSLHTERYATSIGEECFVEARSPDGALAGFVRLALPDGRAEAPGELQGCAIVRELHVYGAALDPGERRSGRAQHEGLGSRLLGAAQETAARAGYGTLAVISAVGTRDYYRARGFVDGEHYQHRPLEADGAGSAPAPLGARSSG